MTTQTLRNGDGKDLAIKPGESIQIVAVTGSYTASIIAGVGTPSVIATDATGGNYGPYATGSVIRLRSSPLSEVDFSIGTAPAVVSDTPVMASKTLTGGIELSAGGVPLSVSGAKVWRGIGQAMSMAVQGFSGGANTSITHRTRHYSNTKFRKVRAVLQTSYPTGATIADTNFVDNYNFQVGFELGYTNAITGIAPRKMFTFSGAETASYLAASPPATGYIISDVLDLGRDVAAEEFFGLWTTVEAPGGGSNKIPYQRNSSSFINRFGGSVSGTANIASDTARSASSVVAFVSSQTGASTYYAPCMLLIETDSNLPFVAAIGDSITYGVGEGVAGSSTNGDALGSALGNSGIIERNVLEALRYNCVNFGKGSDGNKFLFTPANWDKRVQLLALANPTHVINANIHNDITPTLTVNGWAATTAYAKWDVVSANGFHFVCIRAGTSGAVSPTGTSLAIVDGGCTWAHLQTAPTLGGSIPRGSSIVIAQMAAVNGQIKKAVPGVQIIAMTGTPDSTSTDTWATAANQTAASGWGDATSRRALCNALIRAKHPLLEISTFFDPCATLEDSYPTETSKWVVNGGAAYVTNDGTHPNSTGYAIGSATLTADKFI